MNATARRSRRCCAPGVIASSRRRTTATSCCSTPARCATPRSKRPSARLAASRSANGKIRTLSSGSWAAWRKTAGPRSSTSCPTWTSLSARRNFTRSRYLDNLRAARDAGVPLGETIIDLAEEAGSQNTIRDHELAERQVTAFVSIQQGCNMDCSFCIVPKTRGDERSRPMEDIVAECRTLAERGVKEITLLGQIVTSYGRRDYAHTGGVTPFVQLLQRVHALDGIERIRFTSTHPRGFKQDLVETYGRLPKLCGYV